MIVIPLNSSLSGMLPRVFVPLLAALVLLLALPGLASATGGVSGSTPTATASSTDGSVDSDDDTVVATTPEVTPETRKPVNKAQVRRAQTLLRITATGKHDAHTRSVVKRFQRLRGLAMSGVVNLPTYIEVKNAFALLETGGASSGDATGTVAPTTDGGGLTVATTPTPPIVLPANLAPITATERVILDKIAECESMNNPRAISGNGLYRGKYQFDRGTWKTVGGQGDPAAATAEEQDQRAAILLRQRGTAPWPICGK